MLDDIVAIHDIMSQVLPDEDTRNKLACVNCCFFKLIRGADTLESLQLKVRVDSRFMTELLPALEKQPERVQIAVGRLFGNNDSWTKMKFKRDTLSRSHRIVSFAAGQKAITDVSYTRIADYMADAGPLIDDVPVCLCDMLCDAFQPDKSTMHWDFLSEIIRELKHKSV